VPRIVRVAMSDVSMVTSLAKSNSNLISINHEDSVITDQLTSEVGVEFHQ
jgi:hypothetical protein